MRSTMMNMALLGMGGSALVAAAAALPVNATRSSTCPSQLGPGLHTIMPAVRQYLCWRPAHKRLLARCPVPAAALCRQHTFSLVYCARSSQIWMG